MLKPIFSEGFETKTKLGSVSVTHVEILNWDRIHAWSHHVGNQRGCDHACGVSFPTNFMGLRIPTWVLDQSEHCGGTDPIFFVSQNLNFTENGFNKK